MSEGATAVNPTVFQVGAASIQHSEPSGVLRDLHFGTLFQFCYA